MFELKTVSTYFADVIRFLAQRMTKALEMLA